MIGRAVHRSDFAVNIAKMLDTHSFLNLFTTQHKSAISQDKTLILQENGNLLLSRTVLNHTISHLLTVVGHNLIL